MENNASDTNSTFSGEDFWNMLQSEKGMAIPVYIKNIFALNNLDNPISFQCVNDDAIRELEQFTRETMKDFLTKGDNLEEYYGRYHKMPEKFRFLIGDRFLIKKLVSYVASKPDEYWKGPSSSPSTSKIPYQTLPFNQVYIKGDIISASENEEEEEDKKNDLDLYKVPPNRAEEKEKLLEQVKSALNRDLRDSPDLLATTDQVEIKVQVRKTFNKLINAEYFVSIANIKCTICPVTITIRKHYIAGKRKPRWVISNFRRHIKSHTKNGSRRRIKGGKVESPNEEDFNEYNDMEIYKEEDETSEQIDIQEDEGQNEVSYRVTW